MQQHKHLKKLLMLQSRIELWEQLGPAVTEEEWEAMTNTLNEVRDLIQLCRGNVNYSISKHALKQFNRDYNRYKTRKPITE